MMKRIIVLSAPSGVGKSTLIKELMPHYTQMAFSVSATTRPMRPGEVDGRDYHFMTQEAFDSAVARGDFIEHARAYHACYGTLKRDVARRMEAGSWVVLDIDAQGLASVERFFADDDTVDILSILALPKTMDVLQERLRGRGESEQVIQQRMALIYSDIKAYSAYRYAVINDDLQVCVDHIRCIFDQHPKLTIKDFPQLFAHQHAQALLKA